jgi:hypothetical protein
MKRAMSMDEGGHVHGWFFGGLRSQSGVYSSQSIQHADYGQKTEAQYNVYYKSGNFLKYFKKFKY